MNKPRFSVIVPVYKAEHFLNHCIDSVLFQTFGDLELILVDDGSPDQCPAICDEYAAKDKRIRVIHKQNGGVSSARSAGLDIARGDIIGFCDADDYLEQGALETVARAFSENPAVFGVITGFYRTKIENGEYIHKRICTIPGNRMWSFKRLKRHSVYDSRVMGSVCNKYFSREAIGDTRFCEELSYCEDTHFVFRVCNQNETLFAKVLSIPIYNYVTNPDSVTAINRNADKLFAADGRLKYDMAMERILSDCQMDVFTKTLIHRAKFVLAADALRGFSLNREQSRTLKDTVKREVFAYLIHPFAGGFWKNLRRLGALTLKWKRF